MGAAIKRVLTTHRHQWELRTPVAHVEVLKALNWAAQDFQEVRGRAVEYDDDIWLVGDEERVIVYFDAPAPDGKPSSGAS